MKLEQGDAVAIISPSSQQRGADVGLVDQATEQLMKWGLSVRDLTNLSPRFYLAGADASRADSLRQALLDPSIKAIFCTRGGYGSPRLMPYLREWLNVSSKFLVGYSDVSALHMAAGVLWPQVIRVHGPNVATVQFLGDGDDAVRNRNSLHELLFSGECNLNEPVESLCPGRADGRIEGGCLSLVSSSVGTGLLPNMDGAIIFLEDVGEPPYRIDRMLTQLKNSRLLDRGAGIVFGQMNRCTDPHNDLKDVLRDLLCDFRGPVAFGLKSGHGSTNISVMLGQRVCLDTLAGTIASTA